MKDIWSTNWRLLLILALTSCLKKTTAYNKTCILPPSASGEPQRPAVSGQFTVHVEATFVDKNITMDFIEIYDYHNNRGKLRQIKGGITTDYYYDYNTNELLVVKPDTYSCQVQQLSTAGYMFLLGDNDGHIFSPAAALRFGGQTGTPEVYVGKRVARGINVNQWESCQDWPQSNTSMHVTWAFVDNLAWVASASVVNIPVWCHVTGRVYVNDQYFRSFEHQYEFIHFIDNIPPDSEHVFETPSGVVCPGRKNTKPLPALPSALSFTGETINEQRKGITYTQERYDAQGRIVAYKFRGFTSFSMKYGENPLAVVNDFNTGTEYIVDLQRGNCSVTPLSLTPDVTHGQDLVTLRLQSATNMLNLNGNYTYQGQRTIRGIPCDVWIVEKHAEDLLGVAVNATFEWAFSTTSWSYQNMPDSAAGVPVQVIYTLDDFGSRQQSVTNVYDFESSVPDIFEGINLGSCFIGAPRNVVVFSISRVYETLLQYFQSQFKYAVRHSIAQAINVSPLRVANVQYRVQQFSLDISLDLLPLPAVHSTVSDPTTQPSLDAATQALLDAVKGNRMVIQLNAGSDQPSFIVADPNSIRVTRLNQMSVITGRAHPPSVPHPTPTPFPTLTSTLNASAKESLCQQYVKDDTRYSVGVMVGSAMSMGVVGGLLGGLTHRLIIRQVS
ncbi:uncharacterized protein [Littorina saxatilis]|uniref:Uncharacterized protein n=1 Tax=Littorina saxatilis TaxID=31220 RepID=A0AAN9B9G0_9CAEN